MNLSIRSILLLVAVVLFVLAAIGVNVGDVSLVPWASPSSRVPSSSRGRARPSDLTLLLDPRESRTGSAVARASSHWSTEPPTMIESRPSSVSKKAIQRRRSGRMAIDPGGRLMMLTAPSAGFSPASLAFSTVIWLPSRPPISDVLVSTTTRSGFVSRMAAASAASVGSSAPSAPKIAVGRPNWMATTSGLSASPCWMSKKPS